MQARIHVFVAVALLVLPSGAAGAQSDAGSMIARVEAAQAGAIRPLDSLTIPQLCARLQVPGVSIAVIRDSRVHWLKTYGVADVQTKRAVDTNTVFQAASISKPLTAMAALHLVQDGRMSLDADINTILTSWQVPASAFTAQQPVTARSLFSHSSGADDGLGFPGYDPSLPRPTLVQILKGEAPSNTPKVLFTRAPFQAYKYSGGGLVIMQLALTDLVKQPFADFMQATVLGPLGMQHSAYSQPLNSTLAANAAVAHSRTGERMDAPWHIHPELSAAGLWTTPADLARFLIEVQNAANGRPAKVLSYASAKEMITPVGTGPFSVGLIIDKRGEGWYFAHSGGNWGYRADMVSSFRDGYGVVVMTNGDNGSALVTEIESRVAAAYHWNSLDKPLRR